MFTLYWEPMIDLLMSVQAGIGKIIKELGKKRKKNTVHTVNFQSLITGVCFTKKIIKF